MFIGDSRLDRLMDDSLIRAFMQSQVAGLILAGTMPTSSVLSDAIGFLPTVSAGNRDLDTTSVDVVVQDDEEAARLAVQHLLDLGHKRIRTWRDRKARRLSIYVAMSMFG